MIRVLTNFQCPRCERLYEYFRKKYGEDRVTLEPYTDYNIGSLRRLPILKLGNDMHQFSENIIKIVDKYVEMADNIQEESQD